MLDKVHKADVIIIGAGLSGLTLGIELLKKTNKSILILEKKKKLTKDKNWCFWNYPENHFTKKYSKKWDNIKVNWGKLTINKKSSEYYYLNISSKKFYDEALNLINKSPRSKVIFNQKITRIEEKDNLVKV